MINIYTGPSIGKIMADHALDPAANTICDYFLESWREGGLTGTILQISNWNTVGMILGEVRRSEGKLVFCRNRADYENRPEGSFAIMMSCEGYIEFAGDWEALNLMAELGITAFTFSHNVQNLLATGCVDRSGQGGFTSLGKATLDALKELPVMVDLVHLSRKSFWDAIEIYDGDVFVSHANSAAVFDHPRNLTDDQIETVAERNGVIGVTSYRGYHRENPYEATIEDWLDHAMHIYDLVGAEHLAVGADFSGSPMEIVGPSLDAVDPEGLGGLKGGGADIYAVGPKGVEDASRLDRLIAGLGERGLDESELDLVRGGSYLAMWERTRP
ncbi:MAG TPA: membrane dipeptidase [Gaiellaceae bacterium]|nr:membrane dipeptidase [Gaiellaceae bacterium]